MGPALLHEHAIAIRIESVALGDGMTIGVEHPLLAGEGAHQHEQRGLRQMEIGEQRAHHPEFKARIDKNVSLAASRPSPGPIARRNIRAS